MNERYPKSQYIQYEQSLEYEEDYINEESLPTSRDETTVNHHPVARISTKVKSLSKSSGYKYASSYHLKQAEKALKTLKEVVQKPGWEKIITHKSGVVIYSKPGINNDKTPVFMGENIISGVSPQSVFAVIGMRKLWDEWYVEGSLVENLNETVSSTYMVMQGISGTKARDLSLVEKVECTPGGTIFFVATSVDNQKVPHMDGRIRAEVKLNGWILEPVFSSPPKTKVTYVLQANVCGWVPSSLARKYLMRRPLILSNIESYLKKNGPPPMIISTTPTTSRGVSRRSSNISNENDNMDIKYTRKRKASRERREIPRMSSPKEIESSPVMADGGPESPPPHNRQPSSIPSTIPSSPKEVPMLSQFSPVQPIETVSNGHSSSKHHTSTHLSSQRLVDSSSKSKSPRKITHRHTEAANRAIAAIKFLASNYDGWNLYVDNQGVKILTRDVPDKSMPQVRGETIISGGFTPEDVLSVILSMDMRKFWDDRFEEGKIVERLEQDDILARVCMKGTFPISGRDLATISKIEKDPETDTIWLASTSVSDSLIPEGKKHVRAELNIGGWRLRPVIDEFGKSDSVEVTYIVEIDIKLESVPSSILKSISTQTPMCVAKVDELIKKTGHPPYIKTTSGIVISEGLNTKTYQYDLTVGSVDGGSVTEIKISRMMYSSGFNIAIIPENSDIVLLSDKDVVRITLPVGIEIETLNIKVTKNYSVNVQYTFNGANIPIVHSNEVREPQLIVPIKGPEKLEKIVEPLLPPEIPIHHATHENNKTHSTNATLVAEGNGYVDENVLKEYDQPKLGYSPRKSIIDPNTFKPVEDVPKEVSEKKDSKIAQDVKKIDYSIPKPDQFTKKYVPAPFFAFDSTKYVPEPIFMQSSEAYASNDSTLPPSRIEPTTTPTLIHFSHPAGSTPQQRASRRISSRMLPEHMINLTQFESSDISHGIINGDNMRVDMAMGKKEASFNPQEASLMFAFMALAYYVGKLSACGM